MSGETTIIATDLEDFDEVDVVEVLSDGEQSLDASFHNFYVFLESKYDLRKHELYESKLLHLDLDAAASLYLIDVFECSQGLQSYRALVRPD